MAQDAYLTDQQVLAQNPEASDLSRQRKLAEMLTLQAFQQPQGGLVSGHYVAPSWTQQLAPLVSGLAGQQMNKSLDEKQLALADALRQKQTAQIEQYGQLQQKDPDAALRFALSSDNPILRDIAKEELKGIKLGEGEIYSRRNLGGGVTEMKGGEKYHAPIHVDAGSYIELRDPKDPTKVLQRIAKGISPESAARLADEGIGGYGGAFFDASITSANRPLTINPGSPILAKTNATSTASANPFEDFNKSLVPPSNLAPKYQRQWMADAEKPLTGDASARVQGGLDTIDSIDAYRNLLKDYSKLSSLNPTQRANLEAAYYTMTLKSKEANKLGVLNGRDQEILEKLAPNPNDIKSLLVANDVLSQQALKQRNLITGFTLNAYGEQQKKIPKYVMDKIKPLSESQITAAQVGNIKRPSTVDEATWNYMTDAEKALFK